jgi:hypothetical protein
MRALDRIRDHECTDACQPEPVTEWWCPTEQRWTWCHEPCPDGQPHGKTRERRVLMHDLNSTSPHSASFAHSEQDQ